MNAPRASWTNGRPRSAFSGAGLLRARVSWYLSIASMLGFFALPALFQELCVVLESDPDRPGYFEVQQTIPGEFSWHGSYLWLCFLWGLCLALAFFLPRWWHSRVLSRIRLPAVEESLLVSSCSYRTAPARKTLLGPEALERLTAAYLGRLGITILLLWPAWLLACLHAYPMKWFSFAIGCGIDFAGPHEYLPVFVASTILLLSNPPTTSRILGPFAPNFRRGTLDFAIDNTVVSSR